MCRTKILVEFLKMRVFAHWSYELGLQVYTLDLKGVLPYPLPHVPLRKFWLVKPLMKSLSVFFQLRFGQGVAQDSDGRVQRCIQILKDPH